jgi:hypothetical protein
MPVTIQGPSTPRVMVMTNVSSAALPVGSCTEADAVTLLLTAPPICSSGVTRVM